MNRMTIKPCSLCIVVLALVCSSVSSALPLGFIDMGTSTIDRRAGLEWLDVSETESPLFDFDPVSLYLELDSGSGLGADGWRMATSIEFQLLVKNFFQIEFDNYFSHSDILCFGDSPSCESGDLSSKIVEFIDTFIEDGISQFLSDDFLIFGGYILADDSELFLEAFLDREVEWFAGVGEHNRIDPRLGMVATGPIFAGQLGLPFVPLGSFLVRDVPEPSALILFIVGLLGLGVRRIGAFA